MTDDGLGVWRGILHTLAVQAAFVAAALLYYAVMR